MSAVILWFRRDLRVEDNSALDAAVKFNLPIIPLFIWAPDEEKPWVIGAASKWWLQKSLEALSESLSSKKSKLIVRSGKSLVELRALIEETNAKFVFWNRLYDPATKARDEKIKFELSKNGIEAKSFNSSLLHEPWTIQTQSKTPFQVFTPFSRECAAAEVELATKAPTILPAPAHWPKSNPLGSLELLPKSPRWDKKFESYWTPGEAGADARLDDFLAGSRIAKYKEARDYPSLLGTSMLAPHLHFGEISPRVVWQRIKKLKSADWFKRELLWREFAHHILFHFPMTQDSPLRVSFENFAWLKNPKTLRAWERGETGYPIVDAGMRELWETGWMHNRVRMIVASFLTKHLLTHWLSGAKWFWDTLVDADLANNTLGWQWASGCGADAAPYFRIFNPIIQGDKFDGDGIYIRKWIPELSHLPNKFIHRPWESDLPLKYPKPIVNHAEARARALKAFSDSRK